MPPRIVIRPPRREPPIDVNDAWQNLLEPAIKKLYLLEPSEAAADLLYTPLYKSGYRLVTQGHGKTLYTRFAATTREYLESLPPLSLRGGDVMEPLSREWLRFQESLQRVTDVLMYLDGNYCAVNHLPGVEQVGKRLFYDVVVAPVLNEVINEVVTTISRDRQRMVINVPVLKSIIGLFESLVVEDVENSPSLYDVQFRAVLSKSSVVEFNERVTHLEDLPTSSAKLHCIQQWIHDESQRGVNYLPSETTLELLNVLKSEVFEPVLPNIFKDGVPVWLGGDRLTPPTDIDSLRLASELEQSCGPERSLVKYIGEMLVRTQEAINSNANGEVAWVEQTAQCRAKYVLVGDAVGQQALKTVLQPRFYATVAEFGAGAEFLANYLNIYLRKSNAISTDAIEPALERALIIYPALRDRDTFGRIFQRLLARRLINNSTRSEELEINWLRRVRELEDSTTSTSTDSQQFEKMVRDYYLAGQRAQDMRSVTSSLLTVNVLRTDLWPLSMRTRPSYDVRLPPVLDVARTNFEAAYKQMKQDRQLVWNYTLGNVDIKLNVGTKTYLVGAPVYCTTILMLFTGDEVYTAEEVSQKTGIPLGGELERFLKSLYLVPGTELLTKLSGDRKEVAARDTFQFNTAFSSPKSRIKLRVIGAKAAPKQELSPEEKEMLQKDRTDAASAVMVRLMKTHKQMNHAQLVQFAMDRLRPRFQAQPQLLKTAIQYLLAKDFIERSDKDSSVYIYKA